jgi:hypothetical protein
MSDSGFVFWSLFVVTLIGTLVMLALEDAEGAGTPHWEPDGDVIDEIPTGGYANPHAARGPDNIVRRVFQDHDYALKVAYTDDNGSSWSYSTVIDAAWKGHTNSIIGGIVVLANNTTIVHFIADNADDNYNSYVACRWNWSGSWDIIKVYGRSSTALGYPQMAVNETTVLLTYVTGGNTVRYKTFDPTDSTVTPVAGTLPTQWVGAFTYSYDYDVTVNQSGYFIICMKTWSGSVYRFYVRDLDLTHAVVYASAASGVWQMYGVSVMCTSDDTFVIGAGLYWAGGSQEGVVVFHEPTQWSGFIRRDIGLNGQLDVYDWFSVGSCIDDDDDVTFYWANDTGGGGDVHISKMTAAYTASEATWEANIVNAVYDYGTDDDSWYHTDWYDGKYPVVGGYSVNIPDNGWMGHHTYKDEQGSPDDYSFALYWNATFHWYDWSPPAGPGPGPGPGPDEPTPDPGIDWNINPDQFIGLLWLIFIALCAFIALADKVHEISKRRRG